MHKIKLIVNKTWETSPVIEALTNPQFQSAKLPLPAPVLRVSPPAYTRGAIQVPRLVFEIAKDVIVELWCLEDLMVSSSSGSSTSEKVRVLPAICDSIDNVQLVIAVGTAASADKIEPRLASSAPGPSINGSVVVGGAFYMHSGKDPSNPEPWDGKISGISYLDQVIDGKLTNALLRGLRPSDPTALQNKFLLPPLDVGTELIYINSQAIAVSDVNIINYKLYDTQDPLAVAAAREKANGAPLVSVETTHGVIAAATRAYSQKTPIAFISAITDPIGTFPVDVGPRPEAQNFSAAFNVGVYLSGVLVQLAEAIRNP